MSALAVRRNTEWDDFVPPSLPSAFQGSAAPRAIVPDASSAPSTDADRRIAQRVIAKLTGKYMLEDRQDYECELRDVSTTGLAIDTLRVARIGEKVTVKIEDPIGMLDGRVARVFDGGFAITYQLSPRMLLKMETKLKFLADNPMSQIVGRRKEERVKLLKPDTAIHSTLKGTRDATVVNMSRKGVAIMTTMPLRDGEFVRIGKDLKGSVVRVFAGGGGIEFVRLVPMEAFSENFDPNEFTFTR